MYIVEAHDAAGKIDLPLSEVRSELIQQFHRHWLQICGDRRLPTRAEIDPSNFKRILPNVILLDIERDPFRVRYRLCGTKVTELRGYLTGRYLDQVSAEDLRDTMLPYERAAAERRPVFSLGWLTGKLGASHPFQAGIWPLATDGQTVDACVAVEDFPKLQRAAMRHSAVLQAS